MRFSIYRAFARIIFSGLRAGFVALAMLLVGCTISLDNVRVARIERTNGIESLKWKVLPEPARREPQLRVILDTGDNVRELTRRYDMNLSVEAFFCGDRDQRLSVYPAIFDDDGNIPYSPVQATDPDDTQIWIYVALFAKGLEGLHVPYDLTTVEQDICVQLEGANMTLRELRAPVVRIPAAQVRSAANQNDPMRNRNVDPNF